MIVNLVNSVLTRLSYTQIDGPSIGSPLRLASIFVGFCETKKILEYYLPEFFFNNLAKYR